jgi:DNA invertase Pin-like site-specific DNA recombinase
VCTLLSAIRADSQYETRRHLRAVSTDDKSQDPENQLRQLRAWCGSAGHEIAAEYVDRESGRKGTDKRKRFNDLFEDASRRQFDLVLFWALDRFSREGMVPTINYLQRLDSYGIAFHSYTETHLATDNELVRNVLLAVMSSLAKVEAEKISERVKAGLQRGVAKGKTLGRPRIDPAIERKAPRCWRAAWACLKSPQRSALARGRYNASPTTCAADAH